jgi:prepilin-type N-terminal cleavage/methylation domain-containing protein
VNSFNCSRKARAFTLIELLIVVGIIAILAAIAVPNFLEAQVRAKVSRTKADIRTIAVGMETYAVDNNKYPPNYNTGFYPDITPTPASEYLTYVQLTTPIAYLTSTPVDVFGPDQVNPALESYFDFVGIDTVQGQPTEYTAAVRNFWQGHGVKWLITSRGPDRFYSLGANLHEVNIHTYDPTNGTVSRGDFGRTNIGPV